jgi:hypothetical protein
MTISDVFDLTNADGKFAHHMSNFGHMFLHEPKPELIIDEPLPYKGIKQSAYVTAACFVHYWSDVFLMPVPPWVYKEKYKYPEPIYSHPGMETYVAQLTPFQFKEHNYFAPSMEVMYV